MFGEWLLVEGGREGDSGGGSFDYFHREGIWTCALYRGEEAGERRIDMWGFGMISWCCEDGSRGVVSGWADEGDDRWLG